MFYQEKNQTVRLWKVSILIAPLIHSGFVISAIYNLTLKYFHFKRQIWKAGFDFFVFRFILGFLSCFLVLCFAFKALRNTSPYENE